MVLEFDGQFFVLELVQLPEFWSSFGNEVIGDFDKLSLLSIELLCQPAKQVFHWQLFQPHPTSYDEMCHQVVDASMV